RRWRGVFTEIMAGAISTSFDPDEKNRLFRGSAALYTRLFFERRDSVLADGFTPLVIGTYTEDSADLAETMYERAAASPWPFDLRFNYRYPAGRDKGKGSQISPEAYGRMLLRLYNRWIAELPDFLITPLDQMLKKVMEIEVARCPWTKACG